MEEQTMTIDWHFPRDELAKRYMSAFETGITDALAIFAPRRMGKTEFVLLDLAPEAEARGYQVGYCSLWNLQDNPAKALRLALEKINKKGNWKEKWASYAGGLTSEVSASAGGAGFKLKATQKSNAVEEDDLVGIINLIDKLARKRSPTLLLLDEIQHLADERFASLIAMLRTQFEENRKKIHVVYTGSSRDGLQRMFRTRKAPMFHAAQQVDFPELDGDFVNHMIKCFGMATGKKLSSNKALGIFSKIHRNPSMLHQILRHMMIEGIWDIEAGYGRFNCLVDADSDYRVTWNGCKALDQGVLQAIAMKPSEGVYSDDMRVLISEIVGLDSITVKAVQNAIDRLRVMQLIYSPARGEWTFEDPAFADWVKQHNNE